MTLCSEAHRLQHRSHAAQIPAFPRAQMVEKARLSIAKKGKAETEDEIRAYFAK